MAKKGHGSAAGRAGRRRKAGNGGAVWRDILESMWLWRRDRVQRSARVAPPPPFLPRPRRSAPPPSRRHAVPNDQSQRGAYSVAPQTPQTAPHSHPAHDNATLNYVLSSPASSQPPYMEAGAATLHDPQVIGRLRCPRAFEPLRPARERRPVTPCSGEAAPKTPTARVSLLCISLSYQRQKVSHRRAASDPAHTDAQ